MTFFLSFFAGKNKKKVFPLRLSNFSSVNREMWQMVLLLFHLLPTCEKWLAMFLRFSWKRETSKQFSSIEKGLRNFEDWTGKYFATIGIQFFNQTPKSCVGKIVFRNSFLPRISRHSSNEMRLIKFLCNLCFLVSATVWPGSAFACGQNFNRNLNKLKRPI